MTDPTLHNPPPDAASHILALAETVMGDRALSWLTSSKRSLGNATPMDLLDSGTGVRAVEELLYGIDEGFFA